MGSVRGRDGVGFPDILTSVSDVLQHVMHDKLTISLQQLPVLPVPVLALLDEGVQPLMLALPPINLMSLGHWASQYPVPYLVDSQWRT